MKRRLTLAPLLFMAAACRPLHPPADCRAVTERLANETRLAAVLTVHAHALFPELVHGERSDGRMTLADAIDVLRCDAGRGASFRRHRAIATLFAYGFHGHRFDDEVRALGAEPEAITDAVRSAYPVTFKLIFKDPPRLDQAVANLSPDLVGVPIPTDPCEKSIQKELPDVVTDKGTTIVLESTISVATPVATVEKSIDPRRWDNCSLFWDPPDDATHLAVVDASGNPVNDPNDLEPSCSAEKDTSSAPAIGQPFKPRAMFEDFKLTSTDVNARFRNVLTVSADDRQDPQLGQVRSVHYDLPAKGFLCGEIDGVHTTVTIDQGHLDVWTKMGRTWVEFHKEVEYGSAAATSLAQAVTAHHALADELGAIVCCLK